MTTPVAVPHDRSGLVAWLDELQMMVRFVAHRSQVLAGLQGQYRQPMVPKKKWSGWALPLLLVLGAFLGAQLAVGSYRVVVADSSLPAIGESRSVQERRFVQQSLTLAAGLTIGLGGGFGFFRYRNNRWVDAKNASIKQENSAIEAHNRRVQGQAHQLDSELHAAAQDYARRFASGFPQSYLYDEAVGFVRDAVQNHRADTVGQAINLYEQVLHQRRMEQGQAAQLAEAKRATRALWIGNAINVAGHQATQATIRSEGAATRAAMPHTIYVRRR